MKLFESNLSNFRACVLAEATGKSVPQELPGLLAEPVWIDHWADALLLSRARLQVTVAQAAYSGLPAADGLRAELKMVRTRHEGVCQRRAIQARAAPPFAPDDLDSADLALLAAHQEELADLIRQKLEKDGHDPSLAEPPKGELSYRGLMSVA
ncbi:MAG: hypothetical protein DLM55_04800 [Acidimicrobiales bacterium]|nr:MAG: hypothetical protein DLM55_04800 [Acidimicrobiales bacterium]